MEYVLRPGMRLMRRLGVAGKFALIAVLLLLPLCMSMASGFREATGQISVVDTERDGLACVRPLVRLVVELNQTRNRALHDEPPGDAWVAIVRELEDAMAQHGSRFGVVGEWAELRQQVLAVYDADPGAAADSRTVAAERASAKASQLIKDVSDASGLTLDPDLDTHYLSLILVDRLPQLMASAADAQQLRQGEATPSALQLGVSTNAFNDASSQLSEDLTTATQSTTWPGLRRQVSAESWALNSAVGLYARDLAGTPLGNPRGPDAADQLDMAAVSSGAAALGNVVSSALDELLVQRSERLGAERTRPLLLTLIVMTVVFYLLTAMFRATTRDVRAVLEDISTVTNGALNQTRPLSGSDEFSQMSRAVVYARDRLTALVGTLKYQATHDQLTALANRNLFTEKVEEALTELAGTPARGQRAAVLVVDLVAFKSVNDSFGHDLGDRLLRLVGARLHRCVPRRSVVARLGSDVFAVLVTDPRHLRSAREMLGRIEEALAQPVDIEGRLITVQAGIGFAMAEPGDGTTALELIRNADVALSYAKGHGKGHSVIFEPTMHEATRERTELSADLVNAVERGEMNLVYQPIVDLQTNTLHGVEALLRWDHPTRGSVSPNVFVPLAEATGQITRIGSWVLRRACEQLAQWRREHPDAYPLVMEVNLAPEQLAGRDLVSDVLSTVRETGIDASMLVLEITESALVRDVEMSLSRLGQLSASGLTLALDDFGTGYSSLSHLRRLPVTILKIDKSFVGDGSAEGQSLLRSIAELGSGQGMQIVAEGIETPAQADFVRGAGCHLGQGHHWAPALPASRIGDIIAAGGRLPVPASLPRQRPSSSPSSSSPSAPTPPVPPSPFPRGDGSRAEG